MLAPALFTFLIGLGVIFICAQLFLTVAQSISAKWGISPLFISLVVVALGTNLPEIAVTAAALMHQDSALAMANLTGSSIANITLIFGVSTLFGSVKIGNNKTQKNTLILLAATLLFTSLQFSHLEPVVRGLALIVIFVVIIAYQYLLALYGRKREDKKLLQKMAKVFKRKKNVPNYVYVLAGFASIVGLALGGYISVEAIERISELLGMSTTILGLTITAVATSFPELTMVVIASLRRDSQDNKVVLGTLIGSNIINLTLLPAVVLLSSQVVNVSQGERIFLFLSTLSFWYVISAYKGKQVPKLISLLFIGIFAMFLLTTFQI